MRGIGSLARLSLRRRVALVAAVYLAFVGAGQVAGLVSRANLNEALAQARRQLAPAQTSAAALQASLLEQSSGLRGFAVTGEDQFLAPYQLGRLDELSALEMLRQVLQGEPELLEQVEAVRESAALWQSQVANPVVVATSEGRRPDAATIISERGKLLFDPVRAQSDRLMLGIADEVAAGQRRIDAAQFRLTMLVLVVNGTGFTLAVGAIWLLRIWINRPMTALSRSVRQVADGELGQAIQPSGPPEVSALGRDVEAMRRRILEELDTAVRAVEALEQSAPIVVGLRAELAGGGELAPAGLTVASRFSPAEGVLAGDWYDLVVLDDDRVALAVVDISGHGSAAGLFALKVKHFLVPALRLGMAPGDALGWVARQMGDTGDQFATCLVVELTLSTGACRFANAGHPPGLMFRGGQVVDELTLTGPLLGPFVAGWATRNTDLGPDDVLVAYTDGLVEARDPDGKEFGIDRLVEAVTAGQGASAEAIADELMATVRGHSEARLVDDVTLVVMKRA